MKLFTAAQLFFSMIPLCISQVGIMDSGGPLMPEQAAYDVSYYELDLSVDPEKKSIQGSLLVESHVLDTIEWFVLDLDTLLSIHEISLIKLSSIPSLSFKRETGKVWIQLPRPYLPSEKIAVEIKYGGHPRVAERPPWSGGFQWAKTILGAHWIATSCQGEGADLWWPVKDHVSDEPDSMRLHIRVPGDLYVASNGVLEQIQTNPDSSKTFHWFISNPINVYNVALNIAPYTIIEAPFRSIAGDTFPFIFYVLSENYQQGKQIFPEFLEHMKFFEELLGPYPFRNEKYGVAQTPHLGMEHQTIIAYGANFNNAAMTGFDWGFDALHQHELAHEWWGNMVTNADWKDMWIHEGFASYMQPLYVEQKFGKEMYQRFMVRMRRFRNDLPVAPRESQSADQIYRAPIYAKGAWFLHTLRYYLGDEVFFNCLRTMAYPSQDYKTCLNGGQTRFVDTDDFLQICENISGKDLGWLFETYLRQPALPILHSTIKANQLNLKWENPAEVPFPMPIEVSLGEKTHRYEIPESGLQIKIEEGIRPVVDPGNWLLYARPGK